MPHSTVLSAFYRAADAIGRSDLKPHSLRHTYITDDLRYGETDIKTDFDSVVHSSIAITGDVYAVSTAEIKRAAA